MGNDTRVKEVADKNLEKYYLEYVSDLFPSLTILLEKALTIPLSTAVVERSFSKVAIIHNKLRNQLTNPTVDRLLRISLLEDKFLKQLDYDEAYDYWYSSFGERRAAFYFQ